MHEDMRGGQAGDPIQLLGLPIPVLPRATCDVITFRFVESRKWVARGMLLLAWV